MNVEVNYPLGHSITEMGRLDLQSKLFEDPLLLELAHTAGTCLEIGAGTGANLSGLRKANQIIQYHGVDLSSTAIEVAKRTYGSEFTTFAVGDATKLNEANNSFDLVFSKLVLWSMGKHWKNAIIEAHRVLKSGGIFYAFEPYDAGVVCEPSKPFFQEALQHWGINALKEGIDICLGPKIPSALELAGFKKIRSKFFAVLALDNEGERYTAVCDNLMKFYFGDASEGYLTDFPIDKLKRAKAELQATPEGLIMDAFFVTWGEK